MVQEYQANPKDESEMQSTHNKLDVVHQYLPRTLSYTGELRQFQCILVENTTVDNNFVHFSLNVTKFGMLIDMVEIDKSHDFGCYGHYFGRTL